MIGTLPAHTLAALDYRYALDAAMTVLASKAAPAVNCNIPALNGEIRQRLATRARGGQASAALWVEPLAGSWEADLVAMTQAVSAGAPVIVIASRPLARLIPERRACSGTALGLQPRGIGRLCHAFRRSGLALVAHYGIQPLPAIGLSRLGQQISHLGRPDLADRLLFAARLRYCTDGPLKALATVALLIARKEYR